MSKQNLLSELRQSEVLKTPLIISAFEKIDRKEFVPKSCLKEAYEDYPLPIGFEQTISQPWTVAFMFELLQPQPGERIMDIGSGSGYTTALLSEIVGQKGKVYAIEVIPELCQLGAENCKKFSFVDKGIAKFFCQDGNLGLKKYSPYDKILISAALSKKELPQAWKDQLRVSGRIVCPIMIQSDSPQVNSIFVFDKISESEFEEKEHPGFSFVPLV